VLSIKHRFTARCQAETQAAVRPRDSPAPVQPSGVGLVGWRYQMNGDSGAAPSRLGVLTSVRNVQHPPGLCRQLKNTPFRSWPTPAKTGGLIVTGLKVSPPLDATHVMVAEVWTKSITNWLSVSRSFWRLLAGLQVTEANLCGNCVKDGHVANPLVTALAGTGVNP
jgi:hypothetical protein